MKRRKIDKKLKWSIALVIIAVAILYGFHPVYDSVVATVQKITGSEVILIDPGHGGMDGGAQSSAGVCEKDINLAIALYIKQLAEADGWKVVMTREEDKALGSSGSKTIRSQKTADLLARKHMIRDVAPAVAVSVHLNSFKQDTSVRGAQTFYPSGPAEQSVIDESKKLAEAIQGQLILGMNDGTDRTALGKRDVLMFKQPTVPMVIVECGFLSNPDEAKMLEQKDYQKKLAKYIYEGILEYSGKEHKAPPDMIDSRG